MFKIHHGTIASVFALSAGTMLAATPAVAQGQGAQSGERDVIVVTAQRREEAQVDVPISITNINEGALVTANVEELSDIAKVSPGLRFDFASGFVQPTIRGIGTAVTTSGGGGNVGIYVDGFYSPNPLAADFDLLSVESIQVLKGPQGTLFGRNTTGGAIQVNTREPEPGEWAAKGRFSYGRFDEINAQAFVNIPIGERLAMTVEGQARRGGGYLFDANTGDDLGSYENQSIRVGLKADLTDDIEVLLRYKHSETDDPTQVLVASFVDNDFGLGAPTIDTDPDPLVGDLDFVPGSFTTNPNQVAQDSTPEYFRSNSDTVQLTIKADLGFADFTSYSQYRSENVDSSIELDFSALPIFQLGLPNENETWSQEFLLSSKAGSALQWTAGLFYFENTDVYITGIDNGGAQNRIRFGGSGTTVRSYAAFVDATYEVTPQFFVTAGVRYAHDEIDDAYFNTRFLGPLTFTLPNGNVCTANNGEIFIRDCDPAAVEFAKDDRVTPRIVLRYKPNNDMSIYASYTQGYKAAIIDVGGTCQNAPYVCSRVQPEEVDAFEVGFKYSGYNFNFETAAFYYDYKNLQVSLFEAGTAAIVNAASSEIYGLEGQFSWQATPEFRINAGGSYVHARYKDFQNAPVYAPCRNFDGATQQTCADNGISYIIVGQNLNNVTMQRTPEFTGFIGAQYVTGVAGGELALSGNLFYSSELFFGPSGTQFRQGGYETLSLRAQWTEPSEHFYIALWGDNVTDSRYISSAQYNNFGIGANWNKPVTYGIELGFNY